MHPFFDIFPLDFSLCFNNDKKILMTHLKKHGDIIRMTKSDFSWALERWLLVGTHAPENNSPVSPLSFLRDDTANKSDHPRLSVYLPAWMLISWFILTCLHPPSLSVLLSPARETGGRPALSLQVELVTFPAITSPRWTQSKPRSE